MAASIRRHSLHIVTLSVRLPAPLVGALYIAASEDGKDVSTVVRRELERWVAERRARNPAVGWRHAASEDGPIDGTETDAS